MLDVVGETLLDTLQTKLIDMGLVLRVQVSWQSYEAHIAISMLFRGSIGTTPGISDVSCHIVVRALLFA